MTTAMSLDGPWTGLRAYPRGVRTPDARERMEAALQRLQDHRERFDRHIARAQAAVERIDRIVADGIARLDASDPDTDLEPEVDDDRSDFEPSLCGITCNPNYIGTSDLEAEHDGREPDVDDEPSLSAGNNLVQSDNWFHGSDRDLEEQCEDEGAHDEREPEDAVSCAWADEGDQTTLTIRPVYVAPRRIERAAAATGDCALNLAPTQRPAASLPPGWIRISGPALPTFSDGKWSL